MGRPLGLDRNEVARLYESGLSMQDVADNLGCTRPAIYHLMRRRGIPVRTKSEARRLAMARGKLSWQDGTSMAMAYHKARQHRGPICQDCGSDQDLHIHHLDENPWNNDPANLRTLCRGCHKQVHSGG